MFEIIEELSRPGGSRNEDLIWHTPNCLVLLDGATGLTENGESGDHFVRVFIRLFSDCLSQSDSLLSAVNSTILLLREANTSHAESDELPPSAAGAFVFCSNGELQVLTVCDCDVLLVHKNGSVLTLHANDFDSFDASVICQMTELRHSTGKSIAQLVQFPEIRELLLANRRKMNTPGGYRALSYLTEPFTPVDIFRCRAEEIDRVILYSDGFKRMAREMLRGYPLESLYASLRALESGDPTMNRYPRFKQRDDASALIAAVR